MNIVQLSKLCHHQVGLTAAYRAGLPLQEAGWMLYPAATWDNPAIIAMEGAACAAGINWSVDEDARSLSIDFAWCDPKHPPALVKVLGAFRQMLRTTPVPALTIGFTCHEGNQPMSRLVKVLGLAPRARSYRANISDLVGGSADATA